MADARPTRLIDRIKNIKSENLAGYVSLAGSSSIILGQDQQCLAAALLFTTAEITLARAGHTRLGYALGAAGFAAGDAVLAFSPILADNDQLKTALFVMAGTWAVGAARAPLAYAASRLKTDKSRQALTTVADALQPIVGVAVLIQRMPGIVAAFSGGSGLVGTAMSLWGAADILSGRVHITAQRLYRCATRKVSATAGNPPAP